MLEITGWRDTGSENDVLEVNHVSAKYSVHDELKEDVVDVLVPGEDQGVDDHGAESNEVDPFEETESGGLFVGEVGSVEDVGGHSSGPEESPHGSVNPDAGN